MAGLLAFIVLYNLTNINVGERPRELATLKVLGLFDMETYNYISRETTLLSIDDCLTGLLGGIFLYRAVVAAVEPGMQANPRPHMAGTSSRHGNPNGVLYPDGQPVDATENPVHRYVRILKIGGFAKTLPPSLGRRGGTQTIKKATARLSHRFMAYMSRLNEFSIEMQ